MLLDIALMKAYAHKIGVNKISQIGNKISIKFDEDNTVDIDKLKNLLSTSKQLVFNGTLQYNIKDIKEPFVNTLKDIFLFLA